MYLISDKYAYLQYTCIHPNQLFKLKPNYPSDVSEFLTIIALYGEKTFH